MGERLEKFIKNNRKEFDALEVPELLWENLEKELNRAEKARPIQDRVIKLKVLFRIAAGIAIVLAAGICFLSYQKKKGLEISNINPELARQQVHYASIIKERRNELKEIKKEEPQLYQEFSSEIKKLDANYQKLKKDLETSPNQEETLKAMIRNLKVQAQVLHQQLEIFEQVEQLKKDEYNENKDI
ncbi:hypothetical protein [Pedobacter sp. SYSU D00535]|uniref:hypothetical protein n=1 Tax=Pedobacter sp. SYSU D00535 TaxID=2810308 RepID=UPI001A96EE1D|nr:hypothetical protein [Pedobacter sp. SYSU D00535]